MKTQVHACYNSAIGRDEYVVMVWREEYKRMMYEWMEGGGFESVTPAHFDRVGTYGDKDLALKVAKDLSEGRSTSTLVAEFGA